MNKFVEFYGEVISSRLLMGTSRFPSPKVLTQSIEASGSQMYTVSLRREALGSNRSTNVFWENLKQLNCHILPNTAGCYSVKDAVTTAELARQVFGTSWIKLEVIADEVSLMPKSDEMVVASKELFSRGFKVFPYMQYSIELGEKLVETGCEVLMPLGSPIGSGRGLEDPEALKRFRRHFKEQTLVVDAGIGKPSDACLAMELGYDAVLVNTAIAEATFPIEMAKLFADAVELGQKAFQSGLIPKRRIAQPSTTFDGIAEFL